MPLTAEEKRKVRDDLFAAFPREVLPTPLGAWLADYVRAFLEAIGCSCGGPATGCEVAACAVAWAYGPTNAGVPSDTVLSHLMDAARFAQPGDQRAVERGLVFGLGLPPVPPPGGGPWYALWPGGWDALFHLLQQVIRAAVRWIGSRICHLEGRALNRWAFQETAACAAVLRGHLVRGTCDCWRRWADFGVESIVRALFHCLPGHKLAAWDGTEPLDRFLFRVTVGGALVLPNPEHGTPESAYINDFRRGPLATLVSPEGRLLTAGRVLCCTEPNCSGGEVRLDDHCDRCGRLARVESPAWHIWRRDDRVPVLCGRCRECGCLYFQWRERACPNPACGVTLWSPRPTAVWVPAAWITPSNASLLAPPVGEDDPDEAYRRLRALIAGLPPGRERVLPERVFVERVPLARMAEDLRLPPDSEEFRHLAEQVIRLLARMLRGHLDRDADDQN